MITTLAVIKIKEHNQTSRSQQSRGHGNRAFKDNIPLWELGDVIEDALKEHHATDLTIELKLGELK